VSTIRRPPARNVRFYVLIMSVVAMLTLSYVQHGDPDTVVVSDAGHGLTRLAVTGRYLRSGRA